MVNKNREVFLIDWDDAIFAPREKDLWFVKNDPVIMEGYQNIIGKISPNEDIFRFYTLKWNIAEIGDWISRIFFSNDNDIQKQHYYEQLIDEIEILNGLHD